jgi:hypothetical protein
MKAVWSHPFLRVTVAKVINVKSAIQTRVPTLGYCVLLLASPARGYFVGPAAKAYLRLVPIINSLLAIAGLYQLIHR